MEVSHLGLSVLRSLTLCLLSACGSLYVFLSATEGSFLMMASKALIYEYSRITSLRLILLLGSFSRTVVFGFALGPSGSLVTQAVLGMGSIS